jgi:hypothetical protein
MIKFHYHSTDEGPEHCKITALGIEMKCPLCGTVVKSGETHECSSPAPQLAVVLDRLARRRNTGGTNAKMRKRKVQ